MSCIKTLHSQLESLLNPPESLHLRLGAFPWRALTKNKKTYKGTNGLFTLTFYIHSINKDSTINGKYLLKWNHSSPNKACTFTDVPVYILLNNLISFLSSRSFQRELIFTKNTSWSLLNHDEVKELIIGPIEKLKERFNYEQNAPKRLTDYNKTLQQRINRYLSRLDEIKGTESQAFAQLIKILE